MVLFLTGIGLITSLWRFASRDIHGTAVFHNFFAVTGVLAAQKAGGFPDAQILLPLAATAAVATALLAIFDLVWIRRPGRG
jgi:hypothetical protein